MQKPFRIGQIVPSSNVTMETEIPALLRAREFISPERFTFHSSRMRMKHVTKQELAAMDRDSDRCALELSDARVDVMGYACLVAMPMAEALTGKPVLTAAIATTWSMLKALNLDTRVPGGGTLLSGAY
jgi:maleate cis-trans isomerase